MRNTLLTIVCSIVLLGNMVHAQKSQVYTDKDLDYKKAEKLFNKQKYSAAQKQFLFVIDKYYNSESTIKIDALYYNAVCAIELFNSDAEYLITKFINEYPESPRVKEAYFVMATFKYREQKHEEALEWFEKVDQSILSKDEKYEYYFKSGYCYYIKEDYDKAFENFKVVKDSDSKYKIPALYYFSHIAYMQRNFETALIGFQALSDDKKFAPVVPYYITQIYYLQNKYDEVIAYAPPYLKKASVKRQAEIARVIGESYYKKQNFEEALPYIEQYHNEAKQLTKEDYYELGYIYYRTNNYEKARDLFKMVLTENDTIAQNAYYHLADCYIKTDKKDEARNAFLAAMKYDVDKEIQQDAHFSYAKLTYELSYSPFNEAIIAFQEYIEKYPDYTKIDEVYGFLVKVFMSAKNYKDALASIEKIKRRDSELDMAYQRIAYFRGLELFNNLEFRDAITMFDKSLQYGMYDKNLKAMAFYWKAEAFYRLEDYDYAKRNYNDFLLSPGALGKPEYTLAHYNMGYSYFKLINYTQAAIWFRKYTDMTKGAPTMMRGDAFNRIGDSYFMQKSYAQAIKFYKLSIDENQIDVDYASFQVGFCYGLLNDNEQKIKVLSQMISQFPQSAYADDANFEVAKAFMSKEENAKATPYYERIVTEYPQSPYVKESLIQLGLIYYNASNNDQALEVYRQVISDYQGSIESKNALMGVKNIYIGMNDVDGYMNYVNTLGDFAKVSYTEQDSLTYLAAEDAYMKGDCKKAVRLFDGYIKKFPEGIFAINSNYYKADCHFSKKEYDSALVCYTYINNKPKNMFTEQSLLNSANINWTNGNYSEALSTYKKLEFNADVKANLLTARLGQLRCAEKLNDASATIEAAEKLIITDKVTEELIREANFLMAKSYEKQHDYNNAMIKYRTVAIDIKSEEGSESKYKVCKMLFDQKKYDDSEKEILDFLDQNSPHKYWLAKSYILWADIFTIRKDFFQAKHTLQSIIDNYPVDDDGIIENANKKLAHVIKLETVKPVEDKGDVINFTEEENEELFDEDTEINNKEKTEPSDTSSMLEGEDFSESLQDNIVPPEFNTNIDTLQQELEPVQGQ